MMYISLANERQKRQISHERGPLEFGRQPKPGSAQIVVDDPYTSRDQVRLEELDTGDVRIDNLGSPIALPDGSLPSGQSRTLITPVRIGFGGTTLDISIIPADDAFAGAMQTIAQAPRAGAATAPAAPVNIDRAPSAETLQEWFATLLGVQRAAAGSQAFYADTARAVVELVGLDRAMILLSQGDDWIPVASFSQAAGDQKRFSRRVVEEATARRETLFPKFQDDTGVRSLANIEAAVASPIFGPGDEVVGVVYGSRDVQPQGDRRGIDPFEAQLVQLLAGAVSTGLARVTQEAEAARARVQFEQFFSPDLAGALQRHPGILAAKERELTLLFADLRGFSRLAERIGPRQTFDLLADILDRLTNQVMDHGGVVIDYYGDGLAAMWNAPTEQPRHADRAAEAALGMLGQLPELNAAWEEKLGGAIRLGIGLHTGAAQVGNAGSKRRLKYGPRGHAINLASRVEAATKVFGAACLLTGATNSALALAVPRRRIGRARLPGMVEPVELFQLPTQPADAAWLARCQQFQAALSLYERDQAAECLAACQQFEREFGPGDGPLNYLTTKAQERLADSSAAFDPVFVIDTK